MFDFVNNYVLYTGGFTCGTILGHLLGHLLGVYVFNDTDNDKVRLFNALMYGYASFWIGTGIEKLCKRNNHIEKENHIEEENKIEEENHIEENKVEENKE